MLLLSTGAAWAGEAPPDFADLSLEQLLAIEVTSVSKHAEPLQQASAAIFVLTGEDIHRSGAHTIAAALRLVPGLQVRRSNAQNYTVTSRGLSADKLEVLLDGRSVYTPLSSTVSWDVLDTYMPDIERIEVIRGPGATLYGANAVNGVINIVTRHARDTVGAEVMVGGGKEEAAHAAFRSGSKIGEGVYGRIYAKAFERDSTVQRTGADSIDGQRQGQAGFRTDWTPAKAHALTFSGDYYKGTEPTAALGGTSRGDDTDVTGANLLARWSWTASAASEVSVQAYYDGYHRVLPAVFEERRRTGDLQVQHRLRLGDSHTLIYGGGWRGTHDSTGGPPLAIIFSPASRTLQTWSLFAQDQWRLGDAELTVGSKFEHNSYTGFDVQPGVRLGWALGQSAFTWASVSRAVRLPHRIDEDIAIFCSSAISGLIGCTTGDTVRIGNSQFQSEKVVAYEWGLRLWNRELFSVDLAAFHNDYTDLKSSEATTPLVSFDNKMEGQSNGGELALTWAPMRRLTVRPSYGLLLIDLRPANGSTDPFTAPNTEGGSPQQTAGLRVSANAAAAWDVDGFLRYVDGLPSQRVPAYTELNLRVAWRPSRRLELALVGLNLLDAHHPETGTSPSATNPNPKPPATEIQRAIWLDLTWRWQ
ncbi:MAG TPA: TonB-dependent receptor [Candidatus Binatia bacterium]|nr:TonB-dependent receptor [Candidatus Binatia bacterium]